ERAALDRAQPRRPRARHVSWEARVSARDAGDRRAVAERAGAGADGDRVRHAGEQVASLAARARVAARAELGQRIAAFDARAGHRIVVAVREQVRVPRAVPARRAGRARRAVEAAEVLADGVDADEAGGAVVVARRLADWAA